MYFITNSVSLDDFADTFEYHWLQKTSALVAERVSSSGCFIMLFITSRLLFLIAVA